MKQPFSITLAKKVQWKMVKHMNCYFTYAKRVFDAWREKGPQYLDPQLAYIEGGTLPEEVMRSRGIYLLRNGVPTNFDPPYTTKMMRSLFLNVLGKSWDKKCCEWKSEPIPTHCVRKANVAVEDLNDWADDASSYKEIYKMIYSIISLY
jgi:hypothetical protein